jgi:hypothetical protein
MHIRFRAAGTLIFTTLLTLGSVRGQESSLDTSLDFHWNSAIRQSPWFLLLEQLHRASVSGSGIRVRQSAKRSAIPYIGIRFEPSLLEQPSARARLVGGVQHAVRTGAGQRSLNRQRQPAPRKSGCGRSGSHTGGWVCHDADRRRDRSLRHQTF